MRGVERLVEAGGDPSKVASVASFFVSRSTPRPTSGSRRSATTELAGQARDREREARLQALPGGLRRRRAGIALAAAGATVQRPLWASTSTKNPAYRDIMYVEELIGPDTVNTMPPETRRGLPRSRRGARRHGRRGRRRGRAAARRARRGRRRLRRRRRRARDRGRRRSSRDSFDELIAGIRAKRGELARDGDDRAARARRADLVARPDGLDGRGRGPLARLARRAVPDARGRRPAAPAGRRRRRRRSTRRAARDGRLVARAGGAAPRRSAVESFHVLDTTHPQAIRDARGEARPRAHALHLRVEVGLDARDALAHRLLLEARAARRAVGRRSPTPAPSSSGLAQRARVPPPSSPASRRSAAATRRSRRSGSSRRRCSASTSRGCSTARPRWPRPAGSTRATRASSSASRSARAGSDGRDKVCVPDAGGFGALGRAAARRVDRQAGQGARAGARRVARRARPPGAGGAAPGPATSSGRSSSAGSSRPRSPARSSGSTRSTSPTCRPRRTGRTRCSPAGDVALEPEGSIDELLARREARDYVCIQAFVEPDRRDAGQRSPRSPRALGERTGCVVTHGFGPRYLHSTGQLHKGGPDTGLFLQVVEDYGDELQIPGRPFGFGRLIRAQAAGDFASLRERGRRVARVRLEEVI